jgi:hypothetical protein
VKNGEAPVFVPAYIGPRRGKRGSMVGTLEEKQRYQRGSNIKVASAFGLVVASGFVMSASAGSSALASIAAIAGMAMFLVAGLFWFWGLGLYCQSKGYPSSGAVFGLLGIVGLLILLVRPDKFEVATASDGVYPRTPTAGY